MFVHLSLFESPPHQQRKTIKRRDEMSLDEVERVAI